MKKNVEIEKKLNFHDGCICTTNGGYYCWHACTFDQCNTLVDLRTDLAEECSLPNLTTQQSSSPTPAPDTESAVEKLLLDLVALMAILMF